MAEHLFETPIEHLGLWHASGALRANPPNAITAQARMSFAKLHWRRVGLG